MMEINEIPLKDLKNNPYQKRVNYGDIQSLAESIVTRGLQNPISVIRIKGNGHVIVSGHRRAEAFKYLKRKTIPAYIRKETTEKDLKIDIAIENLQRKDLTPVELANTVLQLLYTIETVKNDPSRAVTVINQIRLYKRREDIGNDFTGKLGFRDEDIFVAQKLLKIVGISENTAISYIRILQLPEEIQEKIIGHNKSTVTMPEGMISVKTAYELTRLNDPDIQRSLFDRAISENLKYINVRPIVDELVEETSLGNMNLGKGSCGIRVKADETALKLTDDLFKLSSTVLNFRAKLPLVCRRLDKLLWVASLKKMRKACMEMIRSINELLTDDLQHQDLIEFVNTDLELDITAGVRETEKLRFSFPREKADYLKLKAGDKLILRVERIIRSNRS